jgi:hypothetical protein
MFEKVCPRGACIPRDLLDARTLVQGEDGPIDKPKTVEEVRQEPYNLPDR